METVKEKLIKLIQNGGGFKCGDDAGTFADIPCDGCRYEASEDCMAERIADALIQNGVTIQECGMDCKNCWKTKIVNPVQEWVSVDERLPEENREYNVMIMRGKIATTLHYDPESDSWFDDEGLYTVTHWMPLPKPPKEK